MPMSWQERLQSLECPEDTPTEAGHPIDGPIILILVTVAGVGFLALGGVLVVAYLRFRRHRKTREMRAALAARRNSTYAALGTYELPTCDVVLVDTDVESSTALWEWNPNIMSQSLLMHDDVLRKNLKHYEGTELLTEGDAFLVCFKTVCPERLGQFIARPQKRGEGVRPGLNGP